MKKIKNVCSRFSSGNFISAEKISDSGKFPVYGGNGLRGYTENFNFDGECAIIGRQGAYCGNVKFFSGKGHMTEHAIVAVANEENFTKFLYYKFCLMNFGKYASQSAQPGLSAEFISNLEIDLPPLEVQKQIGNFLYSLDQKISLNKKINATLEDMAKTIYDYYFVQFDFPDENGKPYKSSGGKMIFSPELQREIPEGWQVGNLNLIADYINGLACQNFRPKDNENFLPVVKIREIHDGINFDTEKVASNIPEKNIINDGDILFSWSATLEVNYWAGGQAGLNQHIFKVFPKENFCKEFVYHQLKEYVIHFAKIAESRKTTMGHITQEHLNLSRIAIPPKKILSKFEKKISPIHKKIIQNRQENNLLENLRDFLLPMLMNGQVSFKKED